jgi:hypothetical protein
MGASQLNASLMAVLFLTVASGNGLAAVVNPEAKIRDIEDRWSEAFVSGDTAYLDTLLDPAYVSVGSRGDARPKGEIIAMAARYAAEHPGSHAPSMPSTSKIEIKDSTAIVIHQGKEQTSADVFYYADGRWRALYSQHTSATLGK